MLWAARSHAGMNSNQTPFGTDLQVSLIHTLRSLPNEVYFTRLISADIARRVGYIREDYWIPKRG